LGAREGMGLLFAEWLLTMIEDRLLTWRPETTVNE